MTYDLDADPPRSVQIQRRIESCARRVGEALADDRVFVGLLAVVGLYFADIESATSSATGGATSIVVGWTLEEIAFGLGAIAAVGAVGVVIISLHELCHWLAYRHVGVQAYWTIEWIEVPRIGLKAYPAGGQCWSVSLQKWAELSWAEDAFVSLAPLALSAIILSIVGAYHVLVAPISDPLWVVGGVLLSTGPSPPDYLALLDTPRSKWDRAKGIAERAENHRHVEGFER